jgi:hypothetical protein
MFLFWKEWLIENGFLGTNMVVLSGTFSMICYQQLYMRNKHLFRYGWTFRNHLDFTGWYICNNYIKFLNSIEKIKFQLNATIIRITSSGNYWNVQLNWNAYLNDILSGVAIVWCQSGEIVETFLYVERSMWVTLKGFQQLPFRGNTSHLPSEFCQYYELNCLYLWKQCEICESFLQRMVVFISLFQIPTDLHQFSLVSKCLGPSNCLPKAVMYKNRLITQTDES